MQDSSYLLKSYQKNPLFYDEVFSHSNEAHSFCRRFVRELNELSWHDIKKADEAINRFFSSGEGVSDYMERSPENQSCSMDIIPRVMNSKEWSFIKKGLSQRIKALNMFLIDIYTDEKILKDEIIPKDVIYESPYFLQAMKGESYPFNVFVGFCAPEIIRSGQNFFVLEDNAKAPLGGPDMLLCRQLMRRSFPRLSRKCSVKNVDNYAIKILKSLSSFSENKNPIIALLSPGPYHSAFFEHSFLAAQMGLDLAHGQDLIFDNQEIYMKTIKNLKKVDILYNRMDDIFLALLKLSTDSGSRVQNIFSFCKSGKTAFVNAPGSGLVDDKAVYNYVPKIIKYYLSEEPLLNNVPSYLCREKKGLKYSLEKLPDLIIKPVRIGEGHESFIGPSSPEKQIDSYRKKIQKNPENYIAQPVLDISTSPCFIDGAVQACHVSFKAFVFLGKDCKTDFISGGLCRSSSEKEHLMAWPQQWDRLKDLWILDNANEELSENLSRNQEKKGG